MCDFRLKLNRAGNNPQDSRIHNKKANGNGGKDGEDGRTKETFSIEEKKKKLAVILKGKSEYRGI